MQIATTNIGEILPNLYERVQSNSQISPDKLSSLWVEPIVRPKINFKPSSTIKL